MNYSSLRYYIEIYFYPMECVTWQHQNWLGRDRLSKKRVKKSFLLLLKLLHMNDLEIVVN